MTTYTTIATSTSSTLSPHVLQLAVQYSAHVYCLYSHHRHDCCYHCSHIVIAPLLLVRGSGGARPPPSPPHTHILHGRRGGPVISGAFARPCARRGEGGTSVWWWWYVGGILRCAWAAEGLRGGRRYQCVSKLAVVPKAAEPSGKDRAQASLWRRDGGSATPAPGGRVPWTVRGDPVSPIKGRLARWTDNGCPLCGGVGGVGPGRVIRAWVGTGAVGGEGVRRQAGGRGAGQERGRERKRQAPDGGRGRRCRAGPVHESAHPSTRWDLPTIK